MFGNLRGDDGGDALQTVSAEFSAAAEESPTTAAEATTTIAIPLAAGGSAERALLAGGNAEVVRKEIEELIARAAEVDAAGAPAEAQADAMIATPSCLSSVEGREVLLTAESMLDGEPIVVFVVSANVEVGSQPDSEVPAPEALVFKVADCSVVDLG